MADPWDEILAPSSRPAGPSPSPAPVRPTASDPWAQILAPSSPSATTPTASPSPPEGSWWQRHGRTAEALGAGAALLLAGPRAGQLAAKALPKMGTAGEALSRGAKNIKATFAPSAIDESAGRAAGLWREFTGEAAREQATAQARFEPTWKDIGNATPKEKLDLIKYIEGRSSGATLSNPAHKPLADEVAKAYADVHKDMGNLTHTQKLGFVQDYYRHQWKRTPLSDRVFSREGMATFTKERKIPTIEEGIKQGLTPRTLDPIQTTLEYVANARRFIATNKVIDAGTNNKDVIFRNLGDKSPFPTGDTWLPLDGALGRKGGGQLYAKEGFARVYNNFVSSGFTGPAGEIVNAVRKVSNGITAFELGLSGFHATTMANEAIVNDVAKAVSNLVGKRPDKAFMDLIKAPSAPYRLYKEGKKLEQVYLGQNQGTARMRHMTDLLTKAGGRGAGMVHAKDYEYTSLGSFMQSFRRGSLTAEKLAYRQDIRNNPFMGVPKTALSLVGRTLQTVAEPLFKYYIPRIKNGAFYDTMSQWIEANPTAGKAEQQAAAVKIWDSIDNRFGELVQDNIFWKQHMKQVSMIAMRSYSWNMGTVREIGGGMQDALAHKFSPRVAYIIALPIVYGTVGALYQYLKTGKKPETSQDLMAPQTGGTDPKTGMPERMIMPGYMKDVFGWEEDPVKTATNKASALVTTGINMATGKDWKGDPIREPAEDPNAPYEQTAPAWLKAYFNLATENITPITARGEGPFNRLLTGRKPEGTNITVGEELMGLKPTGKKFVDPEGYKAAKERRAKLDWRKKQKYDARQNVYKGVQ